jgi:tetratricopeptide (TPR) repeat protein
LAGVPDFGPAGILLEAEILEKTGELAKAKALLEGALARFAKHPPLISKLAWIRQRSGDYDGALAAAATLKSLATNMRSRSSAVLLEARLSMAEGRFQEALARLREAYGLEPNNVAILEQIANLAERHDDHERVLQALRQLEAARPDDHRVQQRLKQLEEEIRAKREFNKR